MENINIDRRKFIGSASLISIGLLLSQKSVVAQESPVNIIKKAAATAKIEITKLRGNLSVLEGSGGNILVSTGKDGKLMVDGGIGVSKPNMSAALAKLGNAPLKFLINTHWHFDHVDGNLWLHEKGAAIVAHENTLKNMSRTIRVDDWNFTFPPSPKGALPGKTFADKESMTFNGEDIQMRHYAPAHTNSDISVYFPKADVLHVADTWWNGHYPFIDYNTGGNIKGMIAATNHNIGHSSDKTIIIPGHGPIGNRNQLIAYRDMLVHIYDAVKKLKQQGMTVEEVIKAKPTSTFDAKWGTFIIDPTFFTRLVFKGA
ncbi:MBL fold metallo-hydrolase [Dyadobacter sp. CY261]|uniref:MBL fold metallo-hydrolase n=1 Tax=Dyadobacter sp. CY261 TaxID=2907203 RepID=UPI001F3A108B|nr:MBL fold metallo-hydrolase [Dyadobacter sp. CY261]MCF0074232.1 MBL fold metallo-hydrolase [Dyadobacter sp. CY261]